LLNKNRNIANIAIIYLIVVACAFIFFYFMIVNNNRDYQEYCVVSRNDTNTTFFIMQPCNKGSIEECIMCIDSTSHSVEECLMIDDAGPLWKIDNKTGDTRSEIRDSFLKRMCDNDLFGALFVAETFIMEVSHHFTTEKNGKKSQKEIVQSWLSKITSFKEELEQTNKHNKIETRKKIRHDLTEWFVFDFAPKIAHLLEQSQDDWHTVGTKLK
jgi:hypothetical protein